MYILFLFISFYFIILSYKLFIQIINPLSLYVIIWTITVSLYNSRLILFNEVSFIFWQVIILSLFCYSLMAVFTKLIFNNNNKNIVTLYNEDKLGRQLVKLIVTFSFISMISVVPKFIYIIKTYGINIFSNISNVYQDSIYNELGYSSSFNLEIFNFLGAFFSCIYIQKKGVKKIVFLPVFIAILSQFSSGSRGGFLAILLIYLSAFPVLMKSQLNYVLSRKLKKLLVFTLIFFLIITYFRTSGSETSSSLPFASEDLSKLKNSNFFYSLIFYLTSPLAVLNDFVQNPSSSFFGASTFRIFYGMFSGDKFTINFIGEYLRFVPMSSNVLTYLGELIYDFGFLGMYLSVGILSSLFTYAFLKVKINNSLIWQPIYVVTFCLISLSFFAWFLRPSFYWAILIIGIPITFYLEKSNKI